MNTYFKLFYNFKIKINWLWKKLFLDNFQLVIITNLGNVCQFLTNIIILKYFTIVDLGIFNTVLSIQIISAILLAPLPFFTTKGIIYLLDSVKERNEFISFIFLKTLVLNIISISILFIFIKPIFIFLNLDSRSNILYLIYGLYSLLIAISYYNNSIFQAFAKYKELAIFNLLNFFFKFVFSFLFVIVLKKSSEYVLFGFIISCILSFFYSYFFFIKSIKNLYLYNFTNWKNFKLGFFKYKNIIRQWLPITLTNLAILFLSTSDILFIKHFYSEKDAGIFSAMNFISKITLYFSFIIVQLTYPKISLNHKNKLNSKVEILLIFCANFFFSIPFLLFVYFFPESLILIFSSEKYLSGVNLLQLMTLSMFIFSILNILFYYFMANENFEYLYIVYSFIIVLVLSLYLGLHKNSLDLTFLYFYIYLGILFALLLKMFYPNKKLIPNKNNLR